MNKKKIYFPNLNGLRFVAALFVVIHHIEQIKSMYGIENYWDIVPFIKHFGKLGVILFFVLSGFLITYLLLFEEKTRESISLIDFYKRRILRIWPLYYLIVFLAFFILPYCKIFSIPNLGLDSIESNFFLKLGLYLLFFSNMALSFFGIIPFASHTWSIGTEEQFYIIWPVLLKYFKASKFFLMKSIIILYISIKIFLVSHYSNIIPFKNEFLIFWTTFNIDCMAIGGIFAVLLISNHNYLKYFKNTLLFYLVLVLLVYLIYKGNTFSIINEEVYSLMFGIIILNFAINDKIHISMENPILKYLGTISYGLYMYHPICIVFSIFICSKFGILSNWTLYPLSFLATVVLSGISYKYYELIFIKLKYKYSSILSGN